MSLEICTLTFSEPSFMLSDIFLYSLTISSFSCWHAWFWFWKENSGLHIIEQTRHQERKKCVICVLIYSLCVSETVTLFLASNMHRSYKICIKSHKESKENVNRHDWTSSKEWMKAANTCYCAYCNCNFVDSKRQYPAIVSEDLIMYSTHRQNCPL
jgi:hypothetical protein